MAEDVEEVTAPPKKAEIVYEMQLNTNEPRIPIIIQNASASLQEKVRLRCKINGAVNAENPDLSWVFDGSLLQESDFLKIETNENRRETNLRILEVKQEHIGTYECSVKRTDSRYHKTKLRLMQRRRQSAQRGKNRTEVPCGDHWSTYCQNGGQCMEDVVTKAKSCKCPPGSSGKHCEFFDHPNEVDVKEVPYLPDRDCLDIVCSSADQEYQRSLIMMGTIFGVVLVTVLLCFVYFYQRKRFRRSRSQLLSESDSQTSAIRYHTSLANGRLRGDADDHTRTRLLTQRSSALCSNCGQEISGDGRDLSGHVPSTSISSMELGSCSKERGQERNTPRGGHVYPNTWTRPTSLPSSFSTPHFMNYRRPARDMLPFDPHCLQCLAEWKYFSYPGPPAQGLRYAPMPHYPMVSREYSVVVPANASHAYVQRHINFGNKDRRYGVSDTSMIEDLSGQGSECCIESLNESVLERQVSNVSSHEHQSLKNFPVGTPPSYRAWTSSLEGTKKGPRNVRFQDPRNTQNSYRHNLTRETMNTEQIPDTKLFETPETSQPELTVPRKEMLERQGRVDEEDAGEVEEEPEVSSEEDAGEETGEVEEEPKVLLEGGVVVDEKEEQNVALSERNFEMKMANV